MVNSTDCACETGPVSTESVTVQNTVYERGTEWEETTNSVCDESRQESCAFPDTSQRHLQVATSGPVPWPMDIVNPQILFISYYGLSHGHTMKMHYIQYLVP